MHDDRSDARNTTASATSPGCTRRPRAVRVRILCSTSSSVIPYRRASRAMVSVFICDSTAPGHTAFTLMLNEPTSRASDWVSPITPNLEAQ